MADRYPFFVLSEPTCGHDAPPEGLRAACGEASPNGVQEMTTPRARQDVHMIFCMLIHIFEDFNRVAEVDH